METKSIPRGRQKAKVSSLYDSRFDYFTGATTEEALFKPGFSNT
jgi:hypothetical protein